MGKVSSILGKIFVVIMALITLFPFVYRRGEGNYKRIKCKDS